MDLARKKHPYVDFDRKAEMSMDTFYWSRKCCLEALHDERIPPDTDIGNVIVCRLESRVYISDSDIIELYDTNCSTHGRWRTSKSEKGVKKVVRAALLDEFRDKTVYYEDGKFRFRSSGHTPIQVN